MEVLIKFLAAFILLPYIVFGQDQETGIQFESAHSWESILAKAKTERKYIFVDCYATWCGPCKTMSQEIFPQKKVGDYFNSHFISVALQMDTTSKDAQLIQDWYVDASDFSNKYEIKNFPTLLFFSSEGKPVHRITGTVASGQELVSMGEEAQDPDRQYYTVKGGWINHKGDSIYLAHALTTALQASDKVLAKAIGDEFLDCLRNPITKDNILLFSQNGLINSSKDKWFQLIVKNSAKVDELPGADSSFAEWVVGHMFYDENVAPLYMDENKPIQWNEICTALRIKYPLLGKELISVVESDFKYYIKHDIDGQIYKKDYTAVNWKEIIGNLHKRYPGYDIKPIYLREKALYCYKNKQWLDSERAAYALMHQYGAEMGDGDINDMSWECIFEHSNNKRILHEALKRMKNVVERRPDNCANLDTYANLLYKTGDKAKALEWEKKAVEMALKFHDSYLKELESNLTKIKKGEPTWPDSTPTSI